MKETEKRPEKSSAHLCFATLNMWHGLSFDSKFRFSYLEPKTRRLLREERQLEILKELNADIYFLQEVNPLWDRSLEMGEQLGLSHFEQMDLAGVKVFGLGFPLNLNSGLCTLIRTEWSPRHLENLMLSGPKGSRASTFYSFQLDECRYAVLVEALHPRLGKLLIANTHLHHGLEWKESYRPALDAWIKKYEVSESVQEELFKRLKSANIRRFEEVETLIKYLAPLRPRYQHIILGGDLNFSPGSRCYDKLMDFGFLPQTTSEFVGTKEETLKTWDPARNSANHHFQNQFPPTVFVEDLTFSVNAKAELIQLIRGWEREPRQFDYVMLTQAEHLKPEIKMFGLPDENELAPSDHFGLLFRANFDV